MWKSIKSICEDIRDTWDMNSKLLAVLVISIFTVIICLSGIILLIILIAMITHPISIIITIGSVIAFAGLVTLVLWIGDKE